MINELEVPFDCIGENSEMYKFLVPVKKEVIKIDKDGNKSVETLSYKTKFIDSFRFMSSSLSIPADNLSVIYREKYRDKNCKSEGEFIREFICEFIRMNSWIAGKDLIKYHCLKKRIFLVN